MSTVSCVLHTALSIVYTLHKAHCKKFATNHLRFFPSLFFCEIPPGAKFVYFGYMFESVCVFVCVGGLRELESERDSDRVGVGRGIICVGAYLQMLYANVRP